MTIHSTADGFSVEEAKTGTGLIVGKMVKFTTDSRYKVDKAEYLPDATTLVAIDVATAWVKWQDKKPVEHRVTQPGQSHPERAELPDQDESAWQSGLHGEPTDPWKDTRYLHLIDPLTGADYTFVTDTNGGRRAIGDLKNQIKNIRFAEPNAVPVVRLAATLMPTSFGPKPRPNFRVIEWRTKPAPALRIMNGAPSDSGEPPAMPPPQSEHEYGVDSNADAGEFGIPFGKTA